jgi:hypothetical protein
MRSLHPIPSVPPKFPLWLCILAAPLSASEPSFYLIEPAAQGGTLIHFDTDRLRRYQLQASTNLFTSPSSNVVWNTLFTVPSTPFANHFVILDPDTVTPMKWYRLVANP